MTGEFRADMHVKILDERVVRRAKRRGLDAIVYAPHFERLPAIRARARRFSDDDLLVVPAREIFTGGWRDRKHILAMGLSEPVPDFITLEGAMAELDRQDAAVCVPHPEFLTVSFDADDLATYGEQLDGIEVYNPKHRAEDNERARELARETGIPPFGSSYAHMHRTVGEVWTSFEESFETNEAFVSAIKSGVPRKVYHRDGLLHTLRRHAEFAHLGYENTWKKADRLFLQGMEPTHPDHVAYDGTFDDISVY